MDIDEIPDDIIKELSQKDKKNIPSEPEPISPKSMEIYYRNYWTDMIK